MTSILLCPDKFKGSLTASEVCAALARGLLSDGHPFNIMHHPMADGGDGSLQVLLTHLDLRPHTVATIDPLGRAVKATYYTDDEVAYIELAAASGLVFLDEHERDAQATSTLGTGTLIAEAIAQGYSRVHLFLGGSATNDGGMGIANALGVRFLNGIGQMLEPCGKTLQDIERIDLSGIPESVRQTEFAVLVDVMNPLCGPYGAAESYARQKGATEAVVKQLDAGLHNLANRIDEATGARVAALPGGGAAGGVAAGLAGLFGARIEKGFDYFARATGLDERLVDADAVVSGEGQLDATSLQGKVVGGVGRRCEAAQKPFHLVAGAAAIAPRNLEILNPASIHTVLEHAAGLEDAMQNAEQYVEDIGRRLAELLKASTA